MTPVGATNVGSIRLHFDKNLTTNTVYEPSLPIETASSDSGSSNSKKRVQKATCYRSYLPESQSLVKGIPPFLKGQEMGGFNLGSTVVLVFEAPKNFQFQVKKGDAVRVGQSLGDIVETTTVE